MWAEVLKWGGVGLIVLWADFALWRRMRPEYPEEDILTLCLALTVTAGLGGAGAGRVGRGGAILGGTGVLAWYCQMHSWDVWEWGDFLGSLSLGVGGLLVLVTGG